MKYEIQLNPLLLHNQTLTISDFIEALRQDKPDLLISIGFLDHANNKATIYGSIEIGTFISDNFKDMIRIGAIAITQQVHHSGHATFLDKDGFMKCGCGWVESLTERQDREVKAQLKDMKIIPMDLKQ